MARNGIMTINFFYQKNHRQSLLVIVFVNEMVSPDITTLVMAIGDEGSHMGGQQMGQNGQK